MQWPEFHSDLEKLAASIRAAQFMPDMVVAVARGGWIPTRFLSDLLGVKRIASIGLAYADAARSQLVAYSLPEPIEPKQKILLVEDCLESGRTLLEAKNILTARGAEIRTAALYTIANTGFNPDFAVRRYDSPPPMPWE
jgi:hypoxanthine phosphoribosyltransferase